MATYRDFQLFVECSFFHEYMELYMLVNARIQILLQLSCVDLSAIHKKRSRHWVKVRTVVGLSSCLSSKSTPTWWL